MKIENEYSVNTMLIQKQSNTNGVLSNSFSSLLNQDKKEDHSQNSEPSQEEVNNEWQGLQNAAYLNKIALGILI